MDQGLPSAAPQPPLSPEDYYYEGKNLIFTAAYHLKRGSCCQSGCRHCPYGFTAAAVPGEDAAPPAG